MDDRFPVAQPQQLAPTRHGQAPRSVSIPDPATSALAVPATPVANTRPRLDVIDLLRGLIMVIMALDHTRDFFTSGRLSERDVHLPALFLTRWITHLCASNFVFLTGVGAFLYAARGRSPAQTSRFLLTRGLWLVFLELTVVRVGWSFDLWPELVLLQVIWAIGWSLVVLAGLVFLPRRVLAIAALAVIGGHNLLDPIQPVSWGRFGWIWNLLHKTTLFHVTPRIQILALYPLVPWVAVLAAGFVFGPVFLLPADQRRRRLFLAGTVLLLVFVTLRATGWYGDPAPWTRQDGLLPSALAFLNCEKYPPSLLFLCMTIGPALLAMGLFDRAKGGLARFFITFGRVPLFYYVLHIYLIHALAVGLALLQRRDIHWLFHGLPPMANPQDWDLSLPAVYGIWLLVVLLLWAPCAWFARLKQRQPAWWMSYL